MVPMSLRGSQDVDLEMIDPMRRGYKWDGLERSKVCRRLLGPRQLSKHGSNGESYQLTGIGSAFEREVRCCGRRSIVVSRGSGGRRPSLDLPRWPQVWSGEQPSRDWRLESRLSGRPWPSFEPARKAILVGSSIFPRFSRGNFATEPGTGH